MNLKLNNEQIAYVNGLEDPEAKKDFLVNCFIHQCEEEIKKEEHDLLKFDLPETNEKGYVSFKKGEFSTHDRDLAFALLHFPNLCKPKDSSRESFDKFIEDNGLKKFTTYNPIPEFFTSAIDSWKFLPKKEVTDYTTEKKYTKEDLRKVFDGGRNTVQRFEYFLKLNNME